MASGRQGRDLRRARAQRTRALILGITVSTLLLVVGIVAFGLYRERLLVPRSPVARVNGELILAGQYQKRVRFQRLAMVRFITEVEQQAATAPDEESRGFYRQLLLQAQQEYARVPGRVLERLIEEALVGQEAARRGLVVSEEQLEAEIRRRLGFGGQPDGQQSAPTPPPTAEAGGDTLPTPEPPPGGRPTPDPRDFPRAYEEYLATLRAQTGMSELDFREMARVDLLRAALEASLQAEIPERVTHVELSHIQLPDRESALAALGRVGAGESFEEVAAEVSTDEATRSQGGSLGWVPRGVWGQAFDQVAFELTPGEVSQPVPTAGGWHLLKALGPVEERPLSQEHRRLLESQAYGRWLEQARQQASIQILLAPEHIPQARLAGAG